MHPLASSAQCILQITCMAHDHLMLHTSDFMGIIITCNSKGHILEGLSVMWKITGRTWWVCSTYLVATWCCLSPYCVRYWGGHLISPPCTGVVLICAVQCTRQLCYICCCWAPMLTPGCCEYPSASHTCVFYESPLCPLCPLPSSGPPDFIASSTALRSLKSSLPSSSLSSLLWV